MAFPHLPENTRTIDMVGEIRINQVVIGSCTNGRLGDLRVASEVMKGRKVQMCIRDRGNGRLEISVIPIVE